MDTLGSSRLFSKNTKKTAQNKGPLFLLGVAIDSFLVSWPSENGQHSLTLFLEGWLICTLSGSGRRLFIK